MLTKTLSNFCDDEDGATAVIVALLLTVLLGFAAFGIDMASIYRERAQLQSVSDLTALSVMADTDNATPRAHQALDRNDMTPDALKTLEIGRYLRNPAISASERFTVLPTGDAGINAIRIVLQKDAALHFSQIFTEETSVMQNRTSLTSRTGAASFELNSHLVNLNDDAFNELLAQNFGVNATLSVNDISVLGDVQLSLGAVLDALNAPDIRNPAEVLNATTTVGDFISAAQSVLPTDAASRLSGLTNSAATLSISSIIGGIDTDLGLTATDFLGEITVSGLDLVKAVLATQAHGDSVTINAPTNVAGVINVDTRLTAAEPPAQSGVIAFGEEGVQLHRAAVRLKSDVAVTPNTLGSLGAAVQVDALNLPLYTELAGSTATLDHLNCSLTAPEDVAARFITASTPLHPSNGTSIAALYLGTLPNTAGPINPADLAFADLLDVTIVIPVPLLPDIEIAGITIQARSNATVGASLNDTVTFTKADLSNSALRKSFGSGAILGSAINSLLSPQNTKFRVKPGQEGLVSGVAAPVLAELLATLPAQLLNTLAAPIDSVLDSTLASAGLELGAGELTLTKHHCELIRLVQ